MTVIFTVFKLFTADERQPWTNYEKNENEYLIIGNVALLNI